MPIVFAGEVIRTWASGCIVKNDTLTIAGPYGLTRNPLYFGNFILGLGFMVSSGSPFLVLVFIPIFFFIYNATILKEEQFLVERYGDQFQMYQKKVPRFFPKINRSALSEGRFDWLLVKKHREVNTWFSILAIILLLFLKLWMRKGTV